jgi:hypothetical protein
MRDSFSTLCSVLIATLVAAWSIAVAAQEGPTYNIGRTLTQQELRFADAAIRPDGQGLPPGSGTAEQGAVIFGLRGCAGCHGPTGAEGPAPILVAGREPGQAGRGTVHHEGVGGFSGRGIRNWPFAPLIWSFINRSMPLNQQGYLTASEVYGLVAFLLERNEIIKKGDVMDAKSLAQVKMPGLANYVPPPWVEWTPGLRQREIGK